MAVQRKKVAKKPVRKSTHSVTAKDPEVQKLREELFEVKEELKEKEELLSQKEESVKGSEEVSDVMISHTETKQVEEHEEAKEEAKEEETPKEEEALEEREGEELEQKEEEVREEKQAEAATDSPNETQNGDKEEKSSKKSLLILGVIFLFVGGIIGIFIFSSLQYFSNVKEEKKQEEVIPTIAPTSTPVPEVSYDSYSLQVLNGSGISGQAAQTAGVLEDELGFSEDNVSVGNASDDVEDTTVQLKGSVPETVFDDIKKALSDFTVVLGDPLSDDDTNDVVVTLGTKQE